MEPLDIYSKIQILVKNEIDNSIKAYADQSKFNVTQIPTHQHTGVDSSRIKFEDLNGVPIISAVPTDKPIPGTIRLYSSGGTYKLYAYISGGWRSVVLT